MAGLHLNVQNLDNNNCHDYAFNQRLRDLWLFFKFYLKVEEEEMLVAELKKIELRKKEREKKQQDLQKLITAAEQNVER